MNWRSPGVTLLLLTVLAGCGPTAETPRPEPSWQVERQLKEKGYDK
jgi:hypothetical protein